MVHIKVLGSGCANCTKLAEIAQETAEFMGLEATIEKVTDRVLWKDYALLATPGLVINEKLVCAGRLPSATEVSTWLADSQMVE